MFADSALTYQEDVMFMPEACFPFYSQVYIDYLLSDQAKEDSDGASCFFGLAQNRAKEIGKRAELATNFLICLQHLAANQSRYDADIAIYGDFAKRSAKAAAKIKKHLTD